MSAKPDLSVIEDVDFRDSVASTLKTSAEEQDFAIDETYWGYVIRTTKKPSVALTLLQAVSALFGVVCLLATLALWLMPEALTQGSVIGMKVGASAVIGGMGALCLWFASRGVVSELQVDTRLAEVREVVRNRTGRASLCGRYGFDAFADLSISSEADAEAAIGALVIHHRESNKTVHVARGTVAGLGQLKARLSRDMMLRAREAFTSPYSDDGMLSPA